MKIIYKSLCIVLAAIIILFTVTALAGLTVKEGFVYNRIFKDAYRTEKDDDIGTSAQITFTPKESEGDVSDEVMDKIANVIKKRFLYNTALEADVYVDYKNDTVVTNFPYQKGMTEADISGLVGNLSDTGKVTIYEGVIKDEDGEIDTEKAPEKVLFTSDDIIGAYYGQGSASGKYMVILYFHPEKMEALKEVTAGLIEKKEVMSLWFDGKYITTLELEEALEQGAIVMNDLFTSLVSAAAFSNLINAGAMPVEIESPDGALITPAHYGEGIVDWVLIGGAVAALIFMVAMVVKFKLSGVAAAVGLVGFFGGITASFTGYFADSATGSASMAGIAGAIVAGVLFIDCAYVTANSVKNELGRGREVSKSVDIALKSSFKSVLGVNIAAAVAGAFLVGLCGPWDNLFARILEPVLSWISASTVKELYNFGKVLFTGVIYNMIMGVIVPRIMIKSFMQYKAMRKPKCYGVTEER